MPESRTFTEGEAYALVDDAIKRETATATNRISELEGENTSLKSTNATLEGETTSLKNANDVLATEKAAETQRADQSAQALVDYKDAIVQETARVALRAERVAAVADATDLLEMTDERADRIVAMDEAAFASYVSDLREVAAKAPKEDKKDTPAEDKAEGEGEKEDPKNDPDAAADAKEAKGEDEDDPKLAAKEKAKGKMPRQSAAFGGSTTTATSAGTVKGVIGASRAMRSGN